MRDQEKHIQKKKEQENRRLQERDDLRKVMDTPEGRRFILKLIKRAGVYRCSFTGQSNQTIFNEGERNQGLMLLADVSRDAPGSYELMMKENKDE